MLGGGAGLRICVGVLTLNIQTELVSGENLSCVCARVFISIRVRELLALRTREKRKWN